MFQVFGCDGVTGKYKDGCGVCGGSSSTCTIVESVFMDVVSGNIAGFCLLLFTVLPVYCELHYVNSPI